MCWCTTALDAFYSTELEYILWKETLCQLNRVLDISIVLIDVDNLALTNYPYDTLAVQLSKAGGGCAIRH